MRGTVLHTFNVYLDTAASGRVMAHLLEPPGLGIRFESRADMERGLPAAIRAHLNWLQSHSEPILASTETTYRIAEEVPMAGNFESGDDVGFYAPDTVPVPPEEVEAYLRIGGFAHGDLVGLVSGLSDAEFDWVRDGRTRPVRQILRHVVGAELWYMTRLVRDNEPGLPEIIAEADRRIDATEDVLERLRIVWAAFQLWARSLSEERRRRIGVSSWYAEHKNERWSARKMLRRCIEHCLEHTRNVERILEDYRKAEAND